MFARSLSRDEKPAKPPTVYRAPEFLMAQGLVHRVDSLNAFVGCSLPSEPHRAQFMICDDCGEVSEMDQPAIRRAVSRGAADAGFTVKRHTIELHGLCPACNAA